MFRYVLIASLAGALFRPVLAQEKAPAHLSHEAKPGSSIARSAFAVKQRDSARERTGSVHPQLQASAPTIVMAPVASAPNHISVKTGSSTVTADSAPMITGTVTIPILGAPLVTPKQQPVKPISARTSIHAVEKSPISTELPPSKPKILASREALRERTLLARLDSNLSDEEPRLNRARTRLLQSQRQLGAFTSVLRSAMLEEGDEGNGLHPFVRVAQRYLGTPYVWGGESGRGFDCSGFIIRVMRDLGYRALPHSAAEQFRYGTPIARGLLKAGDVVFFANTYKPGVSHVGIYLGRGRFIHAANSKVGTIISSLNEPKWVAHYAGARRLIRNS